MYPSTPQDNVRMLNVWVNVGGPDTSKKFNLPNEQRPLTGSPRGDPVENANLRAAEQRSLNNHGGQGRPIDQDTVGFKLQSTQSSIMRCYRGACYMYRST